MGLIEEFRLTMLQYLSRGLVDSFALGPEVALSLHASWSAEDIVLQITQRVYGETLGTLEIKRPASWWQMLKMQHAPDWLVSRWPVRCLTETYDARALYPKLCYPDEFHNYTWVGKEGD